MKRPKTPGHGCSSRAVLLAAIVSAAGMGTDTARAEAAPDAKPIEEIVVTARKREERIQEVPLAITAFTGQELQNQGVEDLTTLDQFVPSLSIGRAQGSPTGIDISLRGVAAADDLLTTDRAIGLYLDGVVVPHPFAFATNLFDLQSVEVLKGPQGTLFGKNTVGGAINVRPTKPDYDGVHGYIDGDFGDYQNQDLTAAVNVPLIADRAAMRIALSKSRREGYAEETGRTYCGTDDGTPTGVDLGAPGFNCFTAGNSKLGDDDEWAGRVTFVADPMDGLRMELTIDRSKTEEKGNIEKVAHWYPFEPGAFQVGVDLGILSPADLGSILAGAPTLSAIQNVLATDAWVRANLITNDEFEAPTGGFNNNIGFVLAPVAGLGQFPMGHKFADADTTGYVGTIEFDLTDSLTLKSVTGFREMDVTRSDDIDGTLFVITDAPLDTTSDVFTQELTLSGLSFDSRLNWVAGVYYDNEDGSDGSRAAAVPAFNPFNRNVFDFDVENESWAVFTQGTYAFTDQLRLTAGARYTDENREFVTRNRQQNIFNPLADNCTTGVPGTSPPDGSACEVKKETDADEWSWLVSLDYDIWEGVMAYIKTARSFRGGAFSGRAPTAPPVDPEIVDDIELGLKADWLDGRLRTNVALYRMNYDERQVTVILQQGGMAFTLLQNAAETEINGAEFEVIAQPIDSLSLAVRASWIESTWEKFVGQSQANCFLPAGPTLPSDVLTGTPGQFRGPCSRVRNGDEVEGERPWTYSLHGRYEVPVADLGTLGFQADWSWIDEAQSGKYNSLESPVGNPELLDELEEARGWLNARINFEMPQYGLDIAAYATNLLDEEDIVPSADVSLSYAGVITREPRLWGVQIRKTFGNE